MDSTTSQWSWHNLPDEKVQHEASQEPNSEYDESQRDERMRPSSSQSGSAAYHGEGDMRQRHGVKAETQNSEGNRADAQPPPRQGRYGERTCRICFETIQPRWPDSTKSPLGGYVGRDPKPVYISPDDPDLGRLISPCNCSGSQRYVHEGCLDSWRKQNPGAGGGDNPNYFRCPTCKYDYLVSRIIWARRLQGKPARVALTAVIFLLAIFLLGFFAEPIFSLWNDPVGTIAQKVVGVVDDIEARANPPKSPATMDGDGTWSEHFLKGFFSLGIIGFAKYLLAMTPWQWWNIRSAGMLGQGVRRGGGRARPENISWALVMIGARSFIVSVWKAVGALSVYLLKMAGDNVLDVGGDEEDNDED